jgi:hypothetical protein
MLDFGEINLQLVCLVLRFRTVDGGRTLILRLTVDGGCSVVFLFFLNHKGTKIIKAFVFFVPLWFKKNAKTKAIIPLSLCACLLQTGFKKNAKTKVHYSFVPLCLPVADRVQKKNIKRQKSYVCLQLFYYQ